MAHLYYVCLFTLITMCAFARSDPNQCVDQPIYIKQCDPSSYPDQPRTGSIAPHQRTAVLDLHPGKSLGPSSKCPYPCSGLLKVCDEEAEPTLTPKSDNLVIDVTRNCKDCSATATVLVKWRCNSH